MVRGGGPRARMRACFDVRGRPRAFQRGARATPAAAPARESNLVALRQAPERGTGRGLDLSGAGTTCWCVGCVGGVMVVRRAARECWMCRARRCGVKVGVEAAFLARSGGTCSTAALLVAVRMCRSKTPTRRQPVLSTTLSCV